MLAMGTPFALPLRIPFLVGAGAIFPPIKTLKRH